jgi:glucose/arabinose dehydrogenase/mono/diheme cytochrome c family protein
MTRLTILLVQLALVAAAVFSASFLQNHIAFIPRWLIQLPEVTYTADDLKTVLVYFLAIHAVVIGLAQVIRGRWVPAEAYRTADELFTLMAGFSVSTLAVFLTSTVNFNPDLMVGIALCNAFYHLLVFLLTRTITTMSPLKGVGELIVGLFKRLFTLPGILILLLALTPGILAKAFTSNPDFANKITQIRFIFSPEAELDTYSLASAVGDQRFLQPMQVRLKPGDSNTFYILERPGRLWSLDRSLDQEPSLELDIHDKVGKVAVENGALGFAFHPQFGKEGRNSNRIYLYYTQVIDGKQENRLSTFNLNEQDLEARSRSEKPLFRLRRENSGFHNGGSIEFGPDGFLYVALGEGIRTPDFKSQAKTLRMGILRIDVDKQGGDVSKPIERHPRNGMTADYYIPLDNPFVDNPELLDEYWALGLRNPFRMNFDPETGQLWAGDVGSTKWEEVNRIEKGGHYQFPFIEGHEATEYPRPEEIHGEEKPPVYTYMHTARERAVIGGIVYRGRKFPELRDKYVFADSYASVLYAMDAESDRVEQARKIARGDQYAQRGVSSVSQLPDGNIIVTLLGSSNKPTGEILKLAHGETNQKTDEVVTESDTTPITAEEIESIYAINCSRCHGESGKGDGPDSASLKVEIADFTSPEFQKNTSDAEITRVIKSGGAANGLSPMMPPWGEILSEKEISGLVKHIRETKTVYEQNGELQQ